MSTEKEISVVDRLRTATQLNGLIRSILDAANFENAVTTLYTDLMNLLDCERLTIYQSDRGSDDLVSRFKVADSLREIRVSLSPKSISGFCALSRQTLNLRDVRDSDALREIHPRLNFDTSFDERSGFRTRAMLVVPILAHGALLGVVQAINRRSEDAFDSNSVRIAENLAAALGDKLRFEKRVTASPFDYLIQRGLLSPEQLAALTTRAAEEKQAITSLLSRELRLPAEEIGNSLQRYYQVPYMAYDPSVVIPKDLIRGIKDSYLRSCGWLPVAGDQQHATILIDDPSNHEKLAELRKLVNAEKFSFRVGLADDIARFLGFEVSSPSNTGTTGSGTTGTASSSESTSNSPTVLGEEPDDGDPVVVRLANKLLLQSYLDRASDIHIEPSADGQATVVRLRIDGVMHVAERFPAEMHRPLVSRLKILARLDIAEQRMPQDGKLVVKYKNQPIEFRVATIPTVCGESIILRLLSGGHFLRLDELLLSDHNLKRLRHALHQPHGVFLVVGPTGSGKTTTLHACLHHLNTDERKILTAEDPVEISQPGLQQVQVQPKIGFTFAKAMRAFLRGDPDVIMVGELRDRETAMTGIEASLTGHLVLSTLHSNSAPETLTRLIDLGVDRAAFADALLGTCSQRLMRRLCESCKTPVPLDDVLRGQLSRAYGDHFEAECGSLGTTTVFRHAGCPSCRNTGFTGRIPVHELLTTSPELKRQIVQGAPLEEMVRTACNDGMRTLMQDQIVKGMAGLLDIDEVIGTFSD